MSRAIHIFAPTSAFTSSSKKSDSTLDPIVLFGGIGFLAFLIAILTGVQGVWYYFEGTLNLHRSREDSWKGRGF
jgi:hypothetical protein